jgi:ABC-type Zn uptake system ZnuABC Zn-binding protein ZnuA
MKGIDLVIRIGAGGDPWSDRLIAAAGPNTKIIDAARPEDLAIAARLEGGGSGAVPLLYVWLDPRIVRERIIPAVEQALIGLRPGHADEFRRNSRFFLYELSKLEFEAGALLAQMPKKPFMAQSGAWNFLFNRYSLAPAAIIQADERTEFTPERIAKMVAKGKTEGVGVIFRDLRPPARTLTQIAGRLNARVVPLGIMGNEHPSMANGYLRLMHHNLGKLLTELR